MIRDQTADDRMPGFVIRGQLLFVLAHEHRLALAAHHDLVFGALELFHGHRALVAAGGEQRRLIHQIGEIGARESGRAARDRQRLDKYMDNVREIERRIQAVEAHNRSGEARALPDAPHPPAEKGRICGHTDQDPDGAHQFGQARRKDRRRQR